MAQKNEALEVFRQFAWHLAGTLAQIRVRPAQPAAAEKR